MMRTVILLLFLCAYTTSISSKPSFAKFFSTKTPYPAPNKESDIYPPSNCQPLHYNFVSRHGSREPTDKCTIFKFNKSADILRALGNVSERFSWLREYKIPYKVDMAGQLTSVGAKELFDLGVRLANRFPTLFNSYSPTTHIVRTTQVTRAAHSAAAFTTGLWMKKGPSMFGGLQPVAMTSETKSADKILRPFDMCKNYVMNKKNTYEGDKLFKRISDLLQTELAETLGISPQEPNVTAQLVDSIYSQCTYLISTNQSDQRLCTLLSKRTMAMLDYVGDLKEYYTKSYPRPINFQIASPLLNDIFDTIVAATKGNGELSNLRFAHAETIMPLAALLGLDKEDQLLTSDLNETEMMNRVWKGSKVSPYAANLAFVTYNCSGEYLVQLQQNEIPIKFPNCASLFCPFEKLKEIYHDQLHLSFNDLCG